MILLIKEVNYHQQQTKKYKWEKEIYSCIKLFWDYTESMSYLLLTNVVSPKTLRTALRAVLFPETGCPISTGMPHPSNFSTTRSKLALRALTAWAIRTCAKLFTNKRFSALNNSARDSPPSNSTKYRKDNTQINNNKNQQISYTVQTENNHSKLSLFAACEVTLLTCNN